MQPNYEDQTQAVIDARRELNQPMPRETLAATLFDSLIQPLTGARGATDARQVVLRAQEFDIHLKISTNPSQHEIIGQVFARTETEFVSSVQLHLSLNGKRLKTTRSDNFGQFQ